MRPYLQLTTAGLPRVWRKALLGPAAAALALLFASGCYQRSAHNLGAYILSEKPGEDGKPRVDLYVVEMWGVLPGDTELSGGGITLAPAAAFAPAEAPAPSQRRSFVVLPGAKGEDGFRFAPLANTDLVLHVTNDMAATDAELQALSIVAARIGEAPAESVPKALYNDALLDALRARGDKERALVEAKSRAAEAANLASSAATASDETRGEVERLLDEAQAATDPAQVDAARRAASLAQLKLAANRERSAALEGAARAAAEEVAALEASLASDDSLSKLRSALGDGVNQSSAKKPSKASSGKKPAAKKPSSAKKPSAKKPAKPSQGGR